MFADYRLVRDEADFLAGVTYSPSKDRGARMTELRLVQQETMGLNQEALDEWIEYRREDCKKPMSQRAVDRVVKKLLKYSEAEQARLIDHAIEHEWKGIYWVEPDKKESSHADLVGALENL